MDENMQYITYAVFAGIIILLLVLTFIKKHEKQVQVIKPPRPLPPPAMRPRATPCVGMACIRSDLAHLCGQYVPDYERCQNYIPSGSECTSFVCTKIVRFK